MGPKRSTDKRGGPGGQTGTAPTRRSRRLRNQPVSDRARDDPEAILREARKARGGERTRGTGTGTGRGRGGRRKKAAPRPPQTPPTDAGGSAVPGGRAGSDPPRSERHRSVTEPPPERDTDNATNQVEDAPIGGAEETAKGNGQGETNAGPAPGSGAGKSPNKRDSEDGGDREKSPKKPKTADGGSQPNTPSTTEDRHLRMDTARVGLANELGSLYADGAAQAESVEDEAEEGEDLHQSLIFRAIAAVTEAVTANGGATFTLVDPDNTGFGPTGQGVARPGHTVLFPYTIGSQDTSASRTTGGHFALFVYRPAAGGNGSFAVDNYDSAGRLGGGPQSERVIRAYRETRDRLRSGTWLNNGVLDFVDSPAAPTNRRAPRQRSHWVCGLHVIFTAWAQALGLTLADDGTFTAPFYRHGVAIVNMALRGRVNSQLIQHFLVHYGFVQLESEVPVDRIFDRTTPLLRNDDLPVHIARIRLEDELHVLRETNDAVPDLQLALDVIREAGIELEESHLVNSDAHEIYEQYIQTQEIMAGGIAAAETGDQPGGQQNENADQDPTDTLARRPSASNDGVPTLHNDQQSREHYANVPGPSRDPSRRQEEASTDSFNASLAPGGPTPPAQESQVASLSPQRPTQPNALPATPEGQIPGLGYGVRNADLGSGLSQGGQQATDTAMPDAEGGDLFLPTPPGSISAAENPSVPNEAPETADGRSPLPDYEYYEEQDRLRELFGDDV